MTLLTTIRVAGLSSQGANDILQTLCMRYGGATMAIVEGGYIMRDNELVTERVWQFDIASYDNVDERNWYKGFVALLAKQWSQESVYLSHVIGDASLIFADGASLTLG